MISQEILTRFTPVLPAVRRTPQAVKSDRQAIRKTRSLFWICLLLTCTGVSWFACQYFLFPQSVSSTPDWHGAQWIRAADGNAATAYFRYEEDIKTVPDNAFVTIAASQIFYLYVNGNLIGSNDHDPGSYPRAYMFDVSSSLLPGANAVAIRVDNLDNQIPILRATLSTITGNIVSYSGTGVGWQATTQASLVYPQDTTISIAQTAWTTPLFNADGWPSMLIIRQTPLSPSLTVNPLLYEQPFTAPWLTDGSGQDAYFVRTISLPAGFTGGWLRIVSTGTMNVFMNGDLILSWQYQPTTIQKRTGGVVQYQHELMVGVYDISPYLHAGSTTLAIHVSVQHADGTSEISGNAAPVSAGLALDMLVSDQQGHANWLSLSSGWRVASSVGQDWTTGRDAISTWAPALAGARLSGYNLIYLSQNNLLEGGLQPYQIIPVSRLVEVIAWSILAVIVSWLLMSLLVLRRYCSTLREALAAMSLAYLPAIAFECLLLVLSNEPQIARPFPYTSRWGIVLLVMVGISFGLLCVFVVNGSRSRLSLPGLASTSPVTTLPTPRRRYPSVFSSRIFRWLRNHWPLIPLLLLTLPMVFYGLGYESYWQDELDSFNVAKSISQSGLPRLPSGFLYPKAELYSYILALVMKVFGDQASTLRTVSGVEYVITVALLYYVGCYFFDKRVALLATALLALSTQELWWARQVRMYQQAQLFTLLTVFLFYKAIQERRQIRLIYLAVGVLLLTYLSHEETFIILPGLVICVLLISWVLRAKNHRLPEILYQKHWWIAAMIGSGIIAIQLLIVNITHPPMLGTDLTVRPEIGFTTDNITYYFKVLFSSPDYPALDSILALLGCFWARKSNSLRVKYITLFLLLSMLSLTFILTLQSDRYFYPLATFYYLMDAFALMTMLRAIRTFAGSFFLEGLKPLSSIARSYRFLSLKVFMAIVAIPLFLAVLVMPMLPLRAYNLFVSRALGLSYYHRDTNYTETAQYMRQHMQEGDIVISIVADPESLYYIGQSDYFFSVNRALFLFEDNGHIVDTYTGKIGLINQSDFNTVLSEHVRIWLISDDGPYQRGVLKHFAIPPDFHIVYTAPSISIYLRGG